MTVGKHTATVVVTGQTAGAEKALDQLGKKLEKTEKKLEKANQRGGELGRTLSDPAKIGKAQTAFQSLTSSVGLLRAGLAGVATGAAVQAVNTIRELGAESLRLQNVYANLPFSLDKARTATMGLVDDTTLATAALQAQRFGVVENAAEFAKLAEVATKLAVTSGQDAAKGIADLTTALSRQSPMILDNLGITLRLGEAQTRYAATLGKATKDLTDAEKAEAFRVEAMKAAEVATKDLTVETDGFAASLARAEVAASNFRDGLLGGGAGAVGESPDVVIARLAAEAGKAAAEFEDLVDLQERGSVEQQEAVMRYREIAGLLETATLRGSDLADLNRILSEEGASQEVSAGRLTEEYRKHVADIERRATLDAQVANIGRQRADDEADAASFAAQELADTEALLPIIQQSLAVARAEGASQQQILGLQQDQLSTQMQILDAKFAASVIDAAAFDQEAASLDRQQEILEAQERRARRSRGRRAGPSRAEQVQALIDQADAGDRLAQAEASRMELFRAFHDEETQAQGQQLALLESRITARERELELEETRGFETEGARISRERELMELQVEAASMREQIAFTEEEREEAANAREQLIHEQRVQRIDQRMRLQQEEERQQEEALRKRQETTVGILNISKSAVEGYGKILSEGAKQRGASELQAFNIEKGIKSASLTLDAVTYGAKSAAAFAGLNFVQGAAFAVAASLSGAAAIQTLAATPDTIGAPGAAAGAGPVVAPAAPGIGGERPGSDIPGSPIDGRAGTLPGPGPAVGGGGVSVSIGNFTTLGTVDDETGAKLAQAIDRVKQDGLA